MSFRIYLFSFFRDLVRPKEPTQGKDHKSSHKLKLMTQKHLTIYLNYQSWELVSGWELTQFPDSSHQKALQLNLELSALPDQFVILQLAKRAEKIIESCAGFIINASAVKSFDELRKAYFMLIEQKYLFNKSLI